MANLSLAGWEVEGVEWDPITAEIARENSRLKVHAGDFLSLPLQVDQYGLIYLHHVFEHLDEPREVLKKSAAF
jgi:SAM-dependent methyltransferase